MSRDTLYPQLYRCRNKSCQKVKKEYVWASEVEAKKVMCDCGAKRPMEAIYEEVAEGPLLIGANSGKTYDVKADRRKRARSHFKKEVLPYLPLEDKNAHLQKMKRTGENPHK